MKFNAGKKGQLAFMAIIIMLIIFFFIFRANAEGYDYLTYIAEEQTDLLGNLGSTEMAKDYVKVSVDQIVLQKMYDLEQQGAINHTNDNCIISPDICNSEIKSALEDKNSSLVDYIGIYSQPNRDFEIAIPDYLFNVNCRLNEIEIEAVPYAGQCVDSTPYPATTCNEILDDIECANVAQYDPISDVSSRNGCTWSEEEGFCSDIGDYEAPFCALQQENVDYGTCLTDDNCIWYGCIDNTQNPSTNCDVLDQQNCSTTSGCSWIEPYPSYIIIISEANLFYQFNLQADAHFRKDISCDYYNKIYGSIDALNVEAVVSQLSE